MANIRVIFPKNDKVRKKIRDTYRTLWKAWKQENPTSRAYPLSQLNQNIRRALSIHGRILNENYIENSRYNGWSGRNVIPWCHWLKYYLIFHILRIKSFFYVLCAMISILLSCQVIIDNLLVLHSIIGVPVNY